ncbi:MAG TPA: hydrolase [Clostridiales bacterium]|jgi:2-keto-3-deoxy-6-phosphogluconate aldolase|nr:hydrolase [Clostridiales bacterium]
MYRKTIKKENNIPTLSSGLSDDIIKVPKEISQCSGIMINGKIIKSLIFTTDIAIAMNNNADAILAVYPFTPHPAIFSAIMSVAQMPVFAGVGGGTTQGVRARDMALLAEAQGCIAVVLNAPAPVETFRLVEGIILCPIVATIVSEYSDFEEKIEAGASILNISGAANTPNIVRKIRQAAPDIPIIATGGHTAESILKTIEAGANAISYTPPSNGDLFRVKMDKYREVSKEKYFDNN